MPKCVKTITGIKGPPLVNKAESSAASDCSPCTEEAVELMKSSQANSVTGRKEADVGYPLFQLP